MFDNKDKRKDDNEEVDLTQIINEYEEDRSLRKKIEEMKLKKNNATNEVDKTLVDIEAEQLYEDGIEDEYLDEVEDTIMLEPISKDDDVEDLGETVVIDTKALSDVKDAKKEISPKKQAKQNKIILYVIIGTISLFLIIGGVVAYQVFFKKDADTSEKKETETKKKETDTKKKETETKKKENESIVDNSSKIAQLKGQKDSYIAQRTTEQANLDVAKSQVSHFATLIDAENAALPTKQANINSSTQNEVRLKADYEAAKRLSDASPEDPTLKTATESAKVAWDAAIAATKNYQADYDHSLKTTIPEAIASRDSNSATVKACEATIADLDAKISAVDNDLAKYQ